MATTAAMLATGEGCDLFYELRITGIDARFYSVVNPSDAAKYGAFAHAISTDVAVPGMMTPEGPLTQSLPDIIGGVATAERITLKFSDFSRTTAAGTTYKFMARLFSPGVAVQLGTVYELASDIPASAGSGFPVKLRISWTGVVPPDGKYSVGGETIQMAGFGAADVNGACTGQIVARNMHPCSTVFPPIATHRIVKNETQTHALGRNILVTPYDTPFSMIGRTAALYVGHMVGDIDGVPCAEAEMMLRIVGRIKSFDPTAPGGQFEIEIESVVSELSSAKAASGLGSARIQPDQFLLPLVVGPYSTGTYWRSFTIVDGSTDGNTFLRSIPITIDDTGITDNIYTLQAILNKINERFAIQSPFAYAGLPYRVALKTVGGADYVFFTTYGDALSQVKQRIIQSGLMHALGFDQNEDSSQSWEFSVDEDRSTSNLTVRQLVATRPAPSVFIPLVGTGTSPVRFAIRGLDGSSSQYFFTDQANGQAGVAYVQFSNGVLAKITNYDSDANGDWMTVADRQDLLSQFPSAPSAPSESLAPFYYVPYNEVASVKQVVVTGSYIDNTDPGIFLLQLLASFSYGYAVDEINYFSEGVGMSWFGILDTDSFLILSAMGTNYPRLAVIDSETKLKEIIEPILKEYGAAIVWNPETNLITMRTLRIPGAAASHAIKLEDSNRAKIGDITTHRSDTSNIRTSWTLKWGWDIASKEFKATTPTIVDNAVLSAGVVEKNEAIEDKTLAVGPALDGLLFLSEMIFVRSDVYRQEWRRCKRTMNRSAMTLAPGSYHQVIDVVYDEIGTTIIGGMTNPFTGLPGITAADQIYGILMSVDTNPSTGASNVEFLMSRQGLSSLQLPWAPTGLVDYAAAGRGYNTATGVITFAKRYSSHPTNKDGDAFKVGDYVILQSWDNPHGGAGSYWSAGGVTVSAVAADGSTITVDAGLPGIPVDVEVVVTLTPYATEVVPRRSEVSYQGNAATGIINAVAGARNNKWG